MATQPSPEITISTDLEDFQISTIQPEDMAFAVRMLSQNYIDPHRAVVRELVANAVDSHTEAGVFEPVIVELPSIANPIFRVIDRGVGLSEEGLISSFAQPAGSTKRDCDKQIGYFGIGAKAPHAITDQYIARGTRDGRSASILLVKDAEGVTRYKIMHVSDTDAPNGVIVEVPVQLNEIARWEEAARRAIEHWSVLDVVVTKDGQPLEDYARVDDYTVSSASTDSVLALDADQAETNLMVRLGGVAYQVPPRIRKALPSINRPVVVIADIGTVSVANSRESIEDTDTNLNALSAIVDRHIAEMNERIAGVITATCCAVHRRMLQETAEGQYASIGVSTSSLTEYTPAAKFLDHTSEDVTHSHLVKRLSGGVYTPYTIYWPCDEMGQNRRETLDLTPSFIETTFMELFTGNKPAYLIDVSGETSTESAITAVRKWRRHHGIHVPGGTSRILVDGRWQHPPREWFNPTAAFALIDRKVLSYLACDEIINSLSWITPAEVRAGVPAEPRTVRAAVDEFDVIDFGDSRDELTTGRTLTQATLRNWVDDHDTIILSASIKQLTQAFDIRYRGVLHDVMETNTKLVGHGLPPYFIIVSDRGRGPASVEKRLGRPVMSAVDFISHGFSENPASLIHPEHRQEMADVIALRKISFRSEYVASMLIDKVMTNLTDRQIESSSIKRLAHAFEHVTQVNAYTRFNQLMSDPSTPNTIKPSRILKDWPNLTLGMQEFNVMNISDFAIQVFTDLAKKDIKRQNRKSK